MFDRADFVPRPASMIGPTSFIVSAWALLPTGARGHNLARPIA